jgi:hypothetical protein
VGEKISLGGTENASTGSLIDVMNAQITGVRLMAVNVHSAMNRTI